MQIPKFKDYITEAKGSGPFRIIIISDEPENDKNFHTAKNLLKQAEKLGHKGYIYRNTGGYVNRGDDGELYFHNKDDKKGFRASAKDTIAIIRGSVDVKIVGWTQYPDQKSTQYVQSIVDNVLVYVLTNIERH